MNQKTNKSSVTAEKIYNLVMEALAPIVRKKLYESFNSYEMVLPSVQRWLDDQDSDTPETVELVKYFLNAKDPGYRGLYTIKGVKLMQTLGNSYITDHVNWLKTTFNIAISTNGMLAVVSKAEPNVIIGCIDYDFYDTFINNLTNVCEVVIENMSEYDSQEEFDAEVHDIAEETVENGDSFGFFQ